MLVGNVNKYLSSLIDPSLYSGCELTDQNALVNHYHQYSEYIQPIQLLDDQNNVFSYLDTLPIGSIIYWPEMVRSISGIRDDANDIIKRNHVLTNSSLSSNNFICYTPLLTGAYQRCNGQEVSNEVDYNILNYLISSNFKNGNSLSINKLYKPNLICGLLDSTITDDMFNEVYDYNVNQLGENINDNIGLSYVMRWSAGLGQNHDGSVKRYQNVQAKPNLGIELTSKFSRIRNNTW